MKWFLLCFAMLSGIWWYGGDVAWTEKDIAVVPLRNNTQALLVDAVLNSRVPGVFVVDTGATYTSISRELAEELGIDLNRADKITITTANGRVQVPRVKIKKLSLNGIEGYNVEATVMNIRKGASFSGLLGLSFMKQYRITIDTSSHQLIFQPLSLASTVTPDAS